MRRHTFHPSFLVIVVHDRGGPISTAVQGAIGDNIATVRGWCVNTGFGYFCHCTHVCFTTIPGREVFQLACQRASLRALCVLFSIFSGIPAPSTTSLFQTTFSARQWLAKMYRLLCLPPMIGALELVQSLHLSLPTFTRMAYLVTPTISFATHYGSPMLLKLLGFSVPRTTD